jgi:hypothetical protein
MIYRMDAVAILRFFVQFLLSKIVQAFDSFGTPRQYNLSENVAVRSNKILFQDRSMVWKLSSNYDRVRVFSANPQQPNE